MLLLLRHSVSYIVVRGLPGVINFAALGIYTRLLAPDEFGRYALVLAAIGLAEVAFFQWLRLVVARFLPASRHIPSRFLSEIFTLFLLLALSVSGISLLLAIIWADPVWQRVLALAVPLLLAQALFQFTLTAAAAQLDPGRYGRLLMSKSFLALLIGGWLAWLGLGALAPLAGLLAGHLLALLIFGLATWKGIKPHFPKAETLRSHLTYGVPLAATFALGWVVSSSDRLIIGWLMDEAAVGAYAVGYDLAQLSLGLLLAIVNTAAFPLAIDAMERKGAAAARVQVAENGELIMIISLAGAAGLIVMSHHVVLLLIGEEFRAGALAVLPLIAFGAAISGIKSFHLDIAFHLAARSHWLVITGCIAACINVILNLILIPYFGIVGAAWATIAAFSTAALGSFYLGRRVFAMPSIWPLLARGGLVAIAGSFGAWVGSQIGPMPMGMVFGLILGAAGVLIVSILVNVLGLRLFVKRALEAKFNKT
jgi:O-antigen/teichoic acid export membrane protein